MYRRSIGALIRRTMIFKINPNRPERANNIIADFFSELDEVSAAKFIKISTNPNTTYKDPYLGKHILNYRYVVGVIILSVTTALLNFVQNCLIGFLHKLHLLTVTSPYLVLNFISWVLFSSSLCLAACYLSSFIAKTAEESEIAEVKAVISGLKIPNFFEFKTLVLKFFSVALLVGAGISMSKEGAFVHIAGIISYKLMKTKFLGFIYKNHTRRNQFLSVSFSAGLAAAFGSMFGAVMLSIEISTSFYLVSNIWRASLCTLICTICTQLLQLLNLTESVSSTHFPTIDLTPDIFLFGFLGLFSGLLSYFFIALSKFLVFHRLHRTVPMIHSRYRYFIIVSLCTAVLSFWTVYLEESNISVLNDMFRKDLKNETWGKDLIVLNLMFYVMAKFFITALATSLEAPVGIVFPLFACGAVFGRLFGMMADSIRQNDISEVYAAVGAAALVSASTHSISVSIVIFSITGQIHYLVPMMIAVFIAYSISCALTYSFYDCMLNLKRISYMPLLQSNEMYALTAGKIVYSSFPCISVDSNVGDLIDALFRCTKYIVKIPVIKRDGVLAYEVSVKHAKKYVQHCYEEVKEGFGQTSLDSLGQILKELELIDHDSAYTNIITRQYSQIMVDITEVRKFMAQEIDLNSSVLKIDDSPFSIAHTTAFAKVQFMFLMLNLSQVFVTEKGILVGILVRDSFIKTALRRNYSVS